MYVSKNIGGGFRVGTRIGGGGGANKGDGCFAVIAILVLLGIFGSCDSTTSSNSTASTTKSYTPVAKENKTYRIPSLNYIIEEALALPNDELPKAMSMLRRGILQYPNDPCCNEAKEILNDCKLYLRSQELAVKYEILCLKRMAIEAREAELRREAELLAEIEAQQEIEIQEMEIAESCDEIEEQTEPYYYSSISCNSYQSTIKPTVKRPPIGNIYRPAVFYKKLDPTPTRFGRW